MAQQPLWLKAVLRLERAIGEPVEKAVASDVYYDTVAGATHARRRVIDAVEGISKRMLHLLNLPAGTDVRRMREQLGRIERRLHEVSKELEGLEAERRAMDGRMPERSR